MARAHREDVARPMPPKRWEAVMEAIETARGFAQLHPLETVLRLVAPWLEPESVRAKIMEHYAPSAGSRYGLVFVPAKRPYFPEGGYKIVPLSAVDELIVTVVLTVPTASIEAARRDQVNPLAALIRIEVRRLRAEHERIGLPMPPALAVFFKDYKPEAE